VLSEIGSGEAVFLERISLEPRGHRSISNIEDVPLTFLYGTLDRLISNLVEPQSSVTKTLKKIIQTFEYPGSIWPFIGGSRDDHYWELPNPNWSETDDAIASNLVSVGVLHLVDGLEGKIGKYQWFGRVYGLTSFGLRFLKACSRDIREELEKHEREFERELGLSKKQAKQP
jgi:hypothetical protein